MLQENIMMIEAIASVFPKKFRLVTRKCAALKKEFLELHDSDEFLGV